MKTFVLALVGLVAMAQPASADMDYRCLQLCAKSGQNNSACMGQCSLTENKAVPSVDPAQSSAREFPMMRKLNRNEMLPPRRDMRVREEKDYACIQQCLRAGMREQTCERGCVIEKNVDGKDAYVLKGQKPNRDKIQLDFNQLLPEPKRDEKSKKPLAPLESLPHVKGW